MEDDTIVATFVACDENSGGCFERTCRAKNTDQVQKAWDEFKKDIPFVKWFADNVFYNGPDEAAAFIDGLE